MHVLALPKWYPGRQDPQLGDFIRKQVLAVARALPNATDKVSVVFTIPLSAMDTAELQELDERDGIWELRCYYRPSMAAFLPLRKLINLMRWWSTCSRGVRRLLRERGTPDITHVHILVRPALMAWWLKRTRNIPYLLSEQSSEYLDGTWKAKGSLFQWSQRRLFRQAAAVTAVSAHLAETLVRLGLREVVDVVPNMVPGMDRPLPPQGASERFLVVADLVDRTKNVSGVLRALKAARDQGHALRLEVIGDGPDGPALKELARSLGLNGSVEWSGRISNSQVLDHMGRTGAVIINSNVETFSVVTGEALALGRPVIATRCGGPEAFIREDNGTLIPPKDDRALSEAMIRLSRENARYDPATIRRSVSERFGADAVGKGSLAIYQRVLHG